MEDQAQTKAQLLTKLAALRQRLAQLEALADEREKPFTPDALSQKVHSVLTGEKQ